MKKTATGNIGEYIKTHEALKSYEELRSDVLTMSMFNKVENNKQAAQGPVPMDLNAVMEKVKQSLQHSTSDPSAWSYQEKRSLILTGVF